MLIKLKDPILYETTEKCEFTKSKHLHANILALLFRSRTFYSSEYLGMNLRKMFEMGYGFYVTQAQIHLKKESDYFRSEVQVKSYVDQLIKNTSGSRVIVKYEMSKKNEIISDGFVEFTVVNTLKNRAADLPAEDWKFFSRAMEIDGLPSGTQEVFNEERKTKSIIDQDIDGKVHSKVKLEEIDMYNHVGTTNYLKYILDTVPMEHNLIKSFFIQFKRSLVANDEFYVLWKKNGKSIDFEIRNLAGKVYTQGRLN